MSEFNKDAYASIRLGNQLCFPLYACAKEIVRQYREPLGALGLTYTQYLVMMVLWEENTLTEKALGEKLHLDSGTLAPLLKRLDNQGLVARSRDKNNERMLLVSLTCQGAALKQEALNVPRAMQGCLGLSLDECITLRQLLDKALLHMESNDKRG